jgi:GntR family transcriptional regulator, transcriptional repressor for pyruvate dehydrogenase complex
MWQQIGQTGSVSDRIERQVLDLIAAEHLKPGERLPSERDLAALLKVSRPSVREAVKSLEAQGRLHVRHGRGVFVASPASAQNLRAALIQQEITLSELFAMREVLETPAAGWAARVGDAIRLGAAAEALDALNAAIPGRKRDYDRLQQLDAAFHMRIVEAAGNRFLRQTLGVLQEMLAAGMQTTLLVPGRLESSRTEHGQILDALRNGDATAARAAARRHIRRARAAALYRVREEQESAQREGP